MQDETTQTWHPVSRLVLSAAACGFLGALLLTRLDAQLWQTALRAIAFGALLWDVVDRARALRGIIPRQLEGAAQA